MRKNLFLAVVAFFVAVGFVFAQSSTKPITNEDVIKMAREGFGEDVIIAFIHKPIDKNFDTSSDGLVKFKSALVRLKKSSKTIDKIVAVMLENDTPKPSLEASGNLNKSASLENIPKPKTDEVPAIQVKSEQGPEQTAENDPALRRVAGNIKDKVTGLWRHKNSDDGQKASAKSDGKVADRAAEKVTEKTANQTAKAANQSRPNSYPIFVKAVDSDGFADSELEDSAKDFRADAKPPRFSLVGTETAANVLIAVVKREKRLGEPSDAAATFGTILGHKGPREVTNVFVTLSVKRDGKWVSGIKLSSENCCMTWRAATGKILDKAQKWLDENYK